MTINSNPLRTLIKTGLLFVGCIPKQRFLKARTAHVKAHNLVAKALLADYRGAIDLIYIDPPDSVF